MHNAELLLITGRRFPLHEEMSIGNEVIRTKTSVRYLSKAGSQTNVLVLDSVLGDQSSEDR